LESRIAITVLPKPFHEPIYRGSVWIDKETFALLRRESIQRLH